MVHSMIYPVGPLFTCSILAWSKHHDWERQSAEAFGSREDVLSSLASIGEEDGRDRRIEISHLPSFGSRSGLWVPLTHDTWWILVGACISPHTFNVQTPAPVCANSRAGHTTLCEVVERLSNRDMKEGRARYEGGGGSASRGKSRHSDLHLHISPIAQAGISVLPAYPGFWLTWPDSCAVRSHRLDIHGPRQIPIVPLKVSSPTVVIILFSKRL
jgi:hypothetical protein